MLNFGRGSLVAIFCVGLATAAPLQDTRTEKRVFLPLNLPRSVEDLTTFDAENVEVGDAEIVTLEDRHDSFTLVGRKLGTTHLTLTDKAGKTMKLEVVVRLEQMVPLDVALPLKLTSGKRIRSFQVSDDKIVKIEAMKDDVATVEVTGASEGETGITLVGEDGKVDRVQVFVKKCDRILTVGETVQLRMKEGGFCDAFHSFPEVGNLGQRGNHNGPGKEVAFSALAPGVTLVQFSGPGAGVLETIVVGVKPKAK
jgi:Flp pilus assembly secretin CpaC